MLEYETKELLVQHIDRESFYTLDYLNQQILGIELGYMEARNRPSTISLSTLRSADHKLKQEGILYNMFEMVFSMNYCILLCTAAQMWLLGRLLPMMVGDQVPTGDEYWLSFLDVLHITDLLLAPELTEDDSAHLATLIADHHQLFKQLYPHASITPKMHYLIHMPRLTLE